MKAMILAAGRGERMRPLTETTPKPLLAAGGKPLIQYHVERLVEAGFSELVINVSWLGEQIVQFIEARDWGCHIHWSRESQPLETAGGIIQALPLLGAEPFALVNADIWTDYPLQRLLTGTVLEPASVRLVLVDNPPQHANGDFWLAADGSLVREVPADVAGGAASARLTYAGLGVYHPALFTGCEPGKQALLPLLESAMREGRASGEYYSGEWHDIGTPERLQALDARLVIH